MRISCPSTFSEIDRQWLEALCFETKDIFLFLDPNVVDEEAQDSPLATQARTQEDRSNPDAPRSRIIQSKKERRDALDPAIDEAIKEAGDTYRTADVFEWLRLLALQETPPFTGIVDAAGLHYTDHKNEPSHINKNKLEGSWARGSTSISIDTLRLPSQVC
jgi:hypothetical protein